MTSATPAARRSDAAAGHLYEIDVLRILTFACVIAVHVISHVQSPNDKPMYLLLGLLHFTREVFFALTAFVLVYSYERRPQPMRRFWPKRFLLVGVPYLVWSAIYDAYSDLSSHASLASDLKHYVLTVLNGTAAYHLYFLLTTMQVYLLLPVLMWVVRRTRGRHLLLLIAAAAAQAVVTGVWAYVPNAGHASGNWDNAGFPSYVFVIVAGAVAADHREVFLPWVATHRPRIALLTAATGVVMLGVFVFQMRHGFSNSSAVTALQPVQMLWAIVMGLAFLAVGSWWAERRRPGPIASGVDAASDLSFGIFLTHPLMISLTLLVGGATLRSLRDPWIEVVVYVIVVVAAVLVTVIARRTPLSLALTGRRMQARKRTVSAR